MIVFDLRCSNGHSFEGWFKDLKSFHEQNSERMVTCPFCKSTDISRVLSPVAIKNSQEGKGLKKSEPDYKKLAADVVEYIKNNFDDVGADFAKEALKIHYGVGEKRNIRGSATEGEEKTLKDEGIQFFKIPAFKTHDNDE
jgi:hypothetical protein